MSKFATAVSIYKNEGILDLLVQIFKYLRGNINKKITLFKYPRSAPDWGRVYHIPPEKITESLPQKHLSKIAPNQGVVKGRWDKKTNKLNKSQINIGLIERFGKGQPWEETVYYKSGVRKMNNGKKINRCNASTISDFKEYLHDLDRLFEDIKKNGYDQESLIEVNIGRNGQWILQHGNHRTAIAKILELETIPVMVIYRHNKWQKVRQEFATTECVNELPDNLSKHKTHPDLKPFI